MNPHANPVSNHVKGGVQMPCVFRFGGIDAPTCGRFPNDPTHGVWFENAANEHTGCVWRAHIGDCKFVEFYGDATDDEQNDKLWFEAMRQIQATLENRDSMVHPYCAPEDFMADQVMPGGMSDPVAALREIADLEPRPFVMPADWEEQIAACVECQGWAKNHPIQQGICDVHRRPLLKPSRVARWGPRVVHPAVGPESTEGKNEFKRSE